MNLNHWELAPGVTFDPAAFGFVYIITNLKTGRAYIGCKQLAFKKTLPKNKTRKKKEITTTESDWREYTGSNRELNADIEKHGKQSFSFLILEFCPDKRSLRIAEAKEILNRNALESTNFYNGWLSLKVGKLKVGKLKG